MAGIESRWDLGSQLLLDGLGIGAGRRCLEVGRRRIAGRQDADPRFEQVTEAVITFPIRAASDSATTAPQTGPALKSGARPASSCRAARLGRLICRVEALQKVPPGSCWVIRRGSYRGGFGTGIRRRPIVDIESRLHRAWQAGTSCLNA
jgi:hypothetical protein